MSNKVRVSDEELQYIIQTYGGASTPEYPLRIEVAKDLQDARRELRLFIELAERQGSLTLQDYAREMERKYEGGADA